ncbi:hypothetical protein ETB97_011993 [Aspergillus alliaceus]|uniref:Uncharacterized protein n=1 Tax=Petromyces alliaceus TaxID=209559 RepID=A0A8H6AD83_PETAA|nr:hypothetical protein ETB97_011993 [Aspergillus burnettii]
MAHLPPFKKDKVLPPCRPVHRDARSSCIVLLDSFGIRDIAGYQVLYNYYSIRQKLPRKDQLLHLSSPNFHPQCSFHFIFSLLTLGLALVQISSAAPAPAGALSKRTVENLPRGDQFIECPGYRYSRAQVENAIQRLLSHLRQQPQVFALECQGKKLYEFPIPHEDSVYGGGGPGADRAVFFI